MKILVVEDNKTAMRVLLRTLEKEKYEVFTADNGISAWDLIIKENIHCVISDWVMPGLTGPELCKKIRGANFPHYIFILLLTTKDRKEDIIEGMNAGADDFMAKPFYPEELKARIRAGQRIIKYEDDLDDRNRKLQESNKKLAKAYQIIEKDLKGAAEIQNSLLPESDLKFYNLQFNWLFLPSAYVSGDIFNYFKLDENHVAFYLLDVSGHGVSAAMLSVTLSRVLTLKSNKACILKKEIHDSPYFELTKPSEVISTLNQRFQTLDDTMQYFTMAYGIIDIRDGHVRVSHAGQPPLIHLKKDGLYERMNISGFPVGMIADIEYEEIQFYMKKGERIVLYSDGITECLNKKKEQYTSKRLIEELTSEPFLPLKALASKVETSIRRWNDNDNFEDDISFLAIGMLDE